jgi:hypothetical protein
MVANCITQAYIEGSQAAAVAPLFDPREVRASRQRFFRTDVPQLALANRICVSSGRWPARAWLLVRRQDFASLSAGNTNLSVVLAGAGDIPNLTLSGFSVVQARCVTRGQASDPSAIYLVELTDLRGLVYNQWFQWPTSSAYNVVAPAYPGQLYAASLDVNVPWTWVNMLEDLWDQMTPLGTFPGVPFAVGGTPEGWFFPGTSAWCAFCDILYFLGAGVGVDLTAASPYSIFQGGAADATFAAKTALYQKYLEDDLEFLEQGPGRAPGKVVVYFHRRNQFYGTEETVRLDSLQWESTPFYTVTLPAPAPWAANPGQHILWGDLTVRFDVDNNPLAADVAAALSYAAQLVAQYFQDIWRQGQGYMKRVYLGPLPFACGSLVDGVRWRQDYSDRSRHGWITEIVRGPQPAWPEVDVRTDFYR